MNLIPEELKFQTFPCPNCGQYISSEVTACKFCGLPITEEIRQEAVRKEILEKKSINLKWHKNTMIFGFALIVLGIFFIISPIVEINYSNNVNINCLTPIFVIGGIVIFVRGLIGYREENRKA